MAALLDAIKPLIGQPCEFTEADTRAHDAWFRAKVAHGLARADDPNIRWFSSDQALQNAARRIEAVSQRSLG
jgi:hypothetical protein